MKNQFDVTSRSSDPNPNQTVGGPENKESLNLPPVYAFYRDNKLFQTLIPKIAEDMKNIGRKVIIHSFPSETSEKEIKEYFESEEITKSIFEDEDNPEIKKSFKNIEIFGDDTCNRQMSYDIYKSENNKKMHYLDNFSEKIMGNSLIGKEVFEGKEGEFTYSDEILALQSIVKKVINENGEPENFYIVGKQIDDHNFSNGLFSSSMSTLDELGIEFNTMEEGIEKFRELLKNPDEFNKRLENSQNFKETVALGFDKEKLIDIIKEKLVNEETKISYLKTKDMWEIFISSKIKDSLKSVIEEEKIKIAMKPEDVKKEGRNYILVDRHAEVMGFGGYSYYDNLVELPLPFSNMIESIIKNKILDINFDIDEAVKSEVEKEFKK